MRTLLILGPPAVLCIYFILRLRPLRVEHPNQADAEGRTFVRPFGFITWMEFMDPSSYDERGKKLELTRFDGHRPEPPFWRREVSDAREAAAV